MKKIIIPFILCFFTFYHSLGQQSVTARMNGTQASTETIIREHYYPRTITSKFVEEEFASLLYYVDENRDYRERKIRNCHILDFKTSNDTVFFCGENNNGVGLMGFFEISSFFINGDTMCYIQDSILIPHYFYAKKLTKLITYIHQGTRHVVCIGEAKNYNSFYQDIYSCIVDFQFDFGYLNAYEAGYIDKSDSLNMKSIALDGDHIVVAGFDQNMYLSIRFFDKSNIFNPGGPQFLSYNFLPSSNTYLNYWTLKDVIVTPVDASTFAIATLYNSQYFIGNGSGQSISIIVIDKNVLLSGSTTSPVLLNSNLYCSDYPLTNHLYGFTYNSTKNSYAVLFNGSSYNEETKHSIFCEINGQLSYASNKLIGEDEDNYDMQLQGLDLFCNKQKYIMAGNIAYDPTIYIQMETAGTQSLCLQSPEITFNKLFIPDPEENIHNIYSLSHFSNTKLADLSNIYNYRVLIDCKKHLDYNE